MRDIPRRIDAKARPQRAGTAHLRHVRIGRTEDCRPPRDSPLAGEGECDAGARREQRDCGLERASWRRLDRGAREDLFRAQQIEKLGGALLVELHDGPLRDHEAGVSRGGQDRVEVPPATASGVTSASVACVCASSGKKNAASRAALSRESDPWHAFFCPSAPYLARSDQGADSRAAVEFVGPMSARHAVTAQGRCSTIARTVPDVMKATSPSKKGLPLCSA